MKVSLPPNCLKWKKIIFVNILLLHIDKQYVSQCLHWNNTVSILKCTHKQSLYMLFGSSEFRWYSRQHTDTSTHQDRRSSPPAVWWCQLSPAWLAALQSKHRRSELEQVYSHQLFFDSSALQNDRKHFLSKKKTNRLNWILQCILYLELAK